MKIAIGLPTNRLVKPKTAQSLLRLVASSYYDFHFIVSTRGYNTSENRNYIAAQALKSNCDYLFFVDDDMIFPPETLDDLILCEKDIVGAKYKTKYEVQADVVEYLNDERPSELFGCGAIGTGCLLINTKVFKVVPQPWFTYEWHSNGMVKMSHDWLFCHEARKRGIDVWCEPNIKVQHIGLKEY